MTGPREHGRGRVQSPGLLRPAGTLITWMALVSAWGVLGIGLDLNGPPHPMTVADIVCGVMFAVGVLAAAPIGLLLRRHRAVDLLLWAAIATAAQEFWYALTMFSSSDPTSDDTAVVGVVFSAVPLYGLLLVLLAAGWGLGRVGLRRWPYRSAADSRR